MRRRPVRPACSRSCPVRGLDLMTRLRGMVLISALTMAGPGGTARGDGPSIEAKATWPGMTRAGSVLLPNGWSLKPAGQQSPLGDFPVLMALHPSEPILAVL